MAHNIEFRNGQYSFVESTRQEVAWHGLGKHYDNAITAKEALENCGANFEVGLQPIVALSPDMLMRIEQGQDIDSATLQKMIIEGRKATMRLDENEALGIVSDSYGIVQNAHAFDFIDMLTTGTKDGNTPVIEAAGVLGRGERVFITAKFPEPVRLAKKDDVVDLYIVFTTSHDGSGAVNAMVTPIRVVCNNTLNLALRENSGKLSLRHTSHVTDRLDLTNKDNATMAYKSLNLYNTYREFFEEKLNALAQKKVTDVQLRDIIAKILFPKESYEVFKRTNDVLHDDISTRSKNAYLRLMDSIHSGVGQDECEAGTALWVINGITTHYQNHENWREKRLTKFDSIMDGTVHGRLQNAYDLLEAV